jgi:hypothetical protein
MSAIVARPTFCPPCGPGKLSARQQQSQSAPDVIYITIGCIFGNPAQKSTLLVTKLIESDGI